MVKLKKRIRVIPSLPPSPNDQDKKWEILFTIIGLGIFIGVGYLIYNQLIPYIYAVDVNKIAGKKVVYTKCNIKDYIIIGKDKLYTMQLTNESCEPKQYDGSIIIKKNTIIFNENLSGTIDNEYNIIINNETFKPEEIKENNNESENKKNE